MITLVDQSDTEKLKFHCDRCNRTFTQATRAFLDLHVPNPSVDAGKIGIPPCQPLPVEPAAPVARAPRARKTKVAPVAEPIVAPKKRGRPRKVDAA